MVPTNRSIPESGPNSAFAMANAGFLLSLLRAETDSGYMPAITQGLWRAVNAESLNSAQQELLREATQAILSSFDLAYREAESGRPLVIGRYDLRNNSDQSAYQRNILILNALGFRGISSSTHKDSGTTITEKLYGSGYFTFDRGRLLVTELYQGRSDVSVYVEMSPNEG